MAVDTVDTIEVKLIHPTNNSDIDAEIPVELTLGDVFNQLVEATFLTEGQLYTGVLKPRGNRNDSIPLDNQKSIRANCINNNDTIQIFIATAAAGEVDYIVVDLWRAIYPYLDQVGTVLGITGTVVGFGAWIKNKFSRKYTPSSFVEKLTSKELWNAHELSLKLNISDEDAKKTAKGFWV